MSKALFIAALVAVARARFGQEQIPVAAIQALSNLGDPGVAATLAGQTPGVLLAGANACAKLQLADQLVIELGDSNDVILAALGLVSAEQNFNGFNVATGKMCADASLPVTEALRGVLQLVDPAVLGSDIQNANSALSLTTPFDAVGLSVAEISIAQGFSNFTAEDAEGNAVDLATLGAAGAGAGVAAAADDDVAAAAEVSAACGGGVAAAVEADDEEEEDDEADAEDEDDAAADAEDEDDAAAAGAVAGAGAGAAGTDLAGVDFGLCDPTIRREGGLGGRPANEFTFQSNDPNIEAIQQEALNPNIITNRICDELVNQCEANQAALDACAAAQDAVAAIGAPDDRSDATVDIFNSALGF